MDIPDGFAQINFIFGGTALPTGALSTLHVGGEGLEADRELLPEKVFDAWVAATLPGNFSNATQLREVEIKFGPTATGPTYTHVENAAGTLTGECAPPQVTYLVHKMTDFGGRAGRGRMYLPGIPDASVDQTGAINNSLVEGLRVDLGAFRAALVGLFLVPVLLHGPGSPLSTPTPVTRFVVDSKCATQRRRLRR